MSTPNEKFSPKEVFNLSEALKVTDGDMDIFREIAGIFIKDHTNQVKLIQEGIATGDTHALERAAHSLKGSVSSFGARRAHEAVYRLEVLGKEGKLPEAEEALHELEKELKALVQSMKEIL